MPEAFKQHIIARVQEVSPASILALGPDSAALFADYLQAHPECRCTELQGKDVIMQLDQTGLYDFGLIYRLLEHLNKPKAGVLLSKMRDLHTKRFFALVPMGTDYPEHASLWEAADLIGYGMSFVAAYQQDGRLCHLYKFDIVDYKVTPEWLNSKYWAHPELFDKYRW
jgi:hypothetical protein